MTRWHNLYLPSADPPVAALQTYFTSLGYQVYDPFGLMPGLSYPVTFKGFVAPTQSNWTHVVLAGDTLFDPALTTVLKGTVIYAALSGDQAEYAVYVDGQPVDSIEALTSHLKPGKSVEELHAAFAVNGGDAGNGMPLHLMSDEVRALSSKVNPRQAQNMFNKLSRQLLRGDQQAAAQELVNNLPNWGSSGGRRLNAVMTCLTIPETWREPDYVTVRDAYQLCKRRERRPDASLYPGDVETMAAVPDALSYTPVFMGKTG